MAPFLTAALGHVFGAVSAAIESRGWGDSIKWQGLTEGWREAADQHKPIMCVIHKPSCPACMRLRRVVANSSEIADMSKHFVMVNLEWHEAPEKQSFAPDGKYIPRIIFFTPKGEPLHDVVNSSYSSTKYAYGKAERLMENMEEVRKRFSRGNK